MQTWFENEKGLVKPEKGKKWLPKEKIADQIADGRIKLKNYLPPLDGLRSRLRFQVNEARDRYIVSDINFKNTVFEADTKSCTNMKEKLLEISLLDTNAKVVWIDKNDKPVQMSHSEFKQMLLLIGKRKDSAYILANVTKTAIQTMSRAELASFDVSSLFE